MIRMVMGAELIPSVEYSHFVSCVPVGGAVNCTVRYRYRYSRLIPDFWAFYSCIFCMHSSIFGLRFSVQNGQKDARVLYALHL